MYRVLRFIVVAVCAATAGCGRTDYPDRAPEPGPRLIEREVDLSAIFERAETEGTFVLFDPDAGWIIRHNPARAARGFAPASTFKIPNAIIALETRVAPDADFLLPYRPDVAPRKDWWPSAWAQDQTLATAMRDSVVWYYQEIARRIGPERMQAYVDRFDYGNRTIDGPVDQFWLNGTLQISPDEQVQFLRRFYFGELGISEATSRMIRDILRLRDTSEYRLSGKSGTYELTPTRELAWHVGYIERDDGVVFYALNMEGERVFEDWPPHRRVDLVLQLARAAGVLRDGGAARRASGRWAAAYAG